MTVFGLPSSTHEGLRLTDARIFLSLTTILVVAVSLGLSRAPVERRFRTLQALTVLPIAALPLATGGDDMVIVGFLLLAMVLAQRRRPGWSGLVLGVVSAMKFTAWPLAALALFAARDREGRRAPVKMLLGMLVVIAPVVAPFVAQNRERLRPERGPLPSRALGGELTGGQPAAGSSTGQPPRRCSVGS